VRSPDRRRSRPPEARSPAVLGGLGELSRGDNAVSGEETAPVKRRNAVIVSDRGLTPLAELFLGC
jgi:hypothetical protein